MCLVKSFAITVLFALPIFAAADIAVQPDPRRILQQARQTVDPLPEDWSGELGRVKEGRATADKYKSLREIAETLAQLGDIEGALGIVESRRVRSSDPTLSQRAGEGSLFPSLFPIALAQSRAGERAAAKSTLRRAQQFIDAWPGRSSEPVYYLAELAETQARVGDRVAATEAARRVLKAAADAPPPRTEGLGGPLSLDSVGALRLATRALAAAGEEQAAEDARRCERKVIDAIEDLETRASLLWGMALERMEASDLPGALKVAREVLDLSDPARQPPEDLIIGTRVLAIEFVAGREAEADWDGAVRTVGRLAEAFNKNSILQAIASAPAQTGNWAAALARQRRLLPTVEATWAPTEKPWFLLDLARSQAEAGTRPVALATARRVRTLIDAPGSFTSLQRGNGLIEVARIQAKAGDRPAAFETLRRARAVVASTADDWELFRGFADVAGALADLGDGDEAFRLHAMIPTHFAASKNLAAKAIALALGKAGDLPGARRALDAVVEDRDDPRAALVIAEEVAEQVARERAEAGEVSRALEWADGQKIPLAKVRALIGAARGLMRRPGAGGRKPAAP